MSKNYIKIPIPDWMPTPQEIKWRWNTLKYKLNPYRCIACGTSMDFKRGQFEGKTHTGARLVVSNSKKVLCAEHLSEEIEKHFDTLPKNKKHEVCECCKIKKKTVDIIWGIGDNSNSNIDVRFCTNWWNGHEICLDCIKSALSNAVHVNSHHVHLNGKVYSMNERGALIGPRRATS